METFRGLTVPQTTEEKPYIKFIFDSEGVLSLTTCSNWWGGIDGGFTRYSKDFGESEGNTCEPKDLEEYVKAFVARKISEKEEEIKTLQKELETLKTHYKI